MAFNINEFAARVNTTGLAKNNLFAAMITPPRSVNLPVERDLPFICRSVSIPGMDITTVDIKPQGWGRTEKRASDFAKSNITLTFMVDSDFRVKQFFHMWIQTIVNYNYMRGDLSEDPSNKLPYELDYKDNYSGVIQIEVFSENKDTNGNARSYIYQFDKTFPVAIGSIETAWENQAEIMLITVSFAYDTISVSGMNETSLSSRASSPDFGRTVSGGSFGSTFSGGTSFGNLQQTLGGFGLPFNIQDTVNRVTTPLNQALNSINTVRNASNEFVSSLRKIF